MKWRVAACVMTLIAPLPVWAADCQTDTIRLVTLQRPTAAPFVIAAVPVIEPASAKPLVLLDSTLLKQNPWRAGDHIALCPDPRWPHFVAVTNFDRQGVLYFLMSDDSNRTD